MRRKAGDEYLSIVALFSRMTPTKQRYHIEKVFISAEAITKAEKGRNLTPREQQEQGPSVFCGT